MAMRVGVVGALLVVCTFACSSNADTKPDAAAVRATIPTSLMTPLVLAPAALGEFDADWCRRVTEIAEHHVPVKLYGTSYQMPALPSPDDRFPTLASWKADVEKATAVIDQLIDDAPLAARPAMEQVRKRNRQFRSEQRQVRSTEDAAWLATRWYDHDIETDSDPITRWVVESCPPAAADGPFAQFAGFWSIKGFGVWIGPSGRGRSTSRVYDQCGGVSYPCELIPGLLIVGGVEASFTLTSAQGNVAEAREITTNDPSRTMRSFKLRVDTRCDQLYITEDGTGGYPLFGRQHDRPADCPRE